MLDVFRHDVVSFCTMSRQLVRMVSLEDVGTGMGEINNYLKLTCMRCQMQRWPLLDASRNIQIKKLQIPIAKHLIELNNCIHSFFLAFSHSSVKGCPVIVILLVDASTIQSQHLENATATLWILRKDIHDDMQWRIAIRILLIQISFFVNECLYNRYFKTYHGQMNWTAKNAAAHVHVCTKIN
jgi:hypothetical protein